MCYYFYFSYFNDYFLYYSSYNNTKSELVLERNNGKIIYGENQYSRIHPASLSKLFTIAYALEIEKDMDKMVEVKRETLDLVPRNSSLSNIEVGEYRFEDIIAAILIPSGNDASYVLADYIGGILNPKLINTDERIDLFIRNLNEYIEKEGYKSTKIYSPCGFDNESKSNFVDLKNLCNSLLDKKIIRNLVDKYQYEIESSMGKITTLENTNLFLNPNCKLYNKYIKGIKTGTIANCNNLIILYDNNDREYLILVTGLEDKISTYNEVKKIIDKIDEI